ncbi:hypothetical protein ABZ904_08560 [Streptomyces sp. NPDC046900]|uniref:hypothetical protein n=1 Tax=Streptomyces sp. NPDC046900 TaxID=3155473 RepID=UPI0033C4C696
MSDIPATAQETELLLHLGTMVRDAAGLEVTIEALTGHVIASHNPQSAGVNGEPLSAMLRKCREAARQVPRIDAVQLEDLDKLLNRVAKAAEIRNAYVHGAWARDADGSYLAVRGRRGQTELVTHAVSLDQLVELIREIGWITDGLLEWLIHDLDVAYGTPADPSRTSAPH